MEEITNKINQKDAEGLPHGYQEFYNVKRVLTVKGHYEHGNQVGCWEQFFENGERFAKTEINNKIWSSEIFHSNGSLWKKGRVVGGKTIGIWKHFNNQGELTYKKFYGRKPE